MLFTIILEFEGTTSVSQFAGPSVDVAYRDWFEGLKDPGRYGLNPKQAERLAAALSFDGLRSPTPLASTKNVWCTSTHVDENYALLNFVATLATTSSRAAHITAVTTSNERVAGKSSKARLNQSNRLTASETASNPAKARKARKPHAHNRLQSGNAV